MQHTTQPIQTLASSLDNFQPQYALSTEKNHPFVSKIEDSYAYLQNISQAAEQVSNSLSSYLAAPWNQPKLISLLRQQSSVTSNFKASERKTKQYVDALRKRVEVTYSEPIPLDPSAVAPFCISRLEAWGAEVGMESFKDDSQEGKVTVMLGGKVLVLDVDFSINKEDPLKSRVTVSNVKSSYANSDDASGSSYNHKGSISLDNFLQESIRRYCLEVQKPEMERNSISAAGFASNILQQLRYLMMLDRLAEKKDGARIAWFVDTDKLCPKVEAFAKSEAEAVASSLSLLAAPLDTFLLRSHSLPLPYLFSPSITFLVYVSPRAYLTFLRDISLLTMKETNPNLPHTDIPLSYLRTKLPDVYEGVATATLSVTSLLSPPLFPSSELLTGIANRPTFAFCPHGAEIKHTFPLNPFDDNLPDFQHHIWKLDFTNGGTRPGIVMSQSRMRDIELLVTPIGGITSDLDYVNIISFNTSSWVDLLLNPGSLSYERYTSLYTSPGNLHPPLQLHLTPPDEPGFILEQVPVHNIQEVWGILEIVREQCWLNETLLTCQWIPEPLKPADHPDPNSLSVTDEELQAVLSGTLVPLKIPVNVFLPTSSHETDNLFGGPSEIDATRPRQPKIVMTSPERPPITGLVEITVTLDEERPRGISVEIRGAMGSDLRTKDLEEVCRRGGTFGLPGRVWTNGLSI